LHVLGTPPAFILSQDQTLHKRSLYLAQKNQQAMLHSLVFKEHDHLTFYAAHQRQDLY
jgi:hypothetical protein